jgi:hypothetical protein
MIISFFFLGKQTESKEAPFVLEKMPLGADLHRSLGVSAIPKFFKTLIKY